MVLAGLFIISVCLLAGYALSALTGIPAPASVIGMVLLLGVLLIWRPKRENAIMRGSDVLLAKMSIFFVPAGVGVIAYIAELREAPWAVVLGLVVPVLAALVTSAGAALLTLKLMLKLTGGTGVPAPAGTGDDPNGSGLGAERSVRGEASNAR